MNLLVRSHCRFRNNSRVNFIFSKKQFDYIKMVSYWARVFLFPFYCFLALMIMFYGRERGLSSEDLCVRKPTKVYGTKLYLPNNEFRNGFWHLFLPVINYESCSPPPYCQKKPSSKKKKSPPNMLSCMHIRESLVNSPNLYGRKVSHSWLCRNWLVKRDVEYPLTWCTFRTTWCPSPLSTLARPIFSCHQDLKLFL